MKAWTLTNFTAKGSSEYNTKAVGNTDTNNQKETSIDCIWVEKGTEHKIAQKDSD
jgi:hypothetical protein